LKGNSILFYSFCLVVCPVPLDRRQLPFAKVSMYTWRIIAVVKQNQWALRISESAYSSFLERKK
jgi:hypothetical protein